MNLATEEVLKTRVHTGLIIGQIISDKRCKNYAFVVTNILA